MSTWITLTETLLSPMLSRTQRETVAARPNKGDDNDILTTILEDITVQVRESIRGNEENVLSADTMLLPPELISHAAYLVIESLEGRLGGFIANDAQLDFASVASSTLSRVRNGSLPVSLPDEPQASPNVRTSLGPEIIQRRANPLGAERLRGL